jgi:hypothetical protein
MTEISPLSPKPPEPKRPNGRGKGAGERKRSEESVTQAAAGLGAGEAPAPVGAGSTGLQALRTAAQADIQSQLEQIKTLNFGQAVRGLKSFKGPQLGPLRTGAKELRSNIQLKKDQFTTAYTQRILELYPAAAALVGVTPIENPTLDDALALQASLEGSDEVGQNALHHAIQSRDATRLQTLLDLGCDVHWRDIRGETLPMIALDFDQNDILRRLLLAGAEMDGRNSHGETALMLAVTRKNSEMVRELIGRGANVNAADKIGNTALHCAAIINDAELVKLLLAAGARLSPNRYGETALDMAKGFETSATVDLLQAAQNAD